MREIALFQINLESNDINAFIYMFYPPDLRITNSYLKKLLENNKIKKIIHCSESLDIPYLFNNLFKTNQEQNNFVIIYTILNIYASIII